MKKLILLILCCPLLLAAQTKNNKQQPATNSVHAASTAPASHVFNPDAVSDTVDVSLDDAARQAGSSLTPKEQKLKEQAQQADNDYHVWNATYKRNIFEFQYISGIIIFIVVIFIVFMGLGFSAWQFYITMHQVRVQHAQIVQKTTPAAKTTTIKKTEKTEVVADKIETAPVPAAAPANDPTASLRSDIEISTSGIKINSSVLGVIIIALSLAFFYMYLVYVYPINMVNQEKPDSKIEAKK